MPACTIYTKVARCSAWSELVVSGGVEPPTFRFQAWRHPSSQRNVRAWRGAAACRCQRLAAAIAVTVAVGQRGLVVWLVRQPGA